MIAIYLFCTGEYAILAKDFLETLHRWMPNEEKVVCLVSDDDTFKDFKGDNIRVEYHHTEHYPWPVVTLYKFYLMKRYKIEGAKMHFYFNANVVFTDVCSEFDWSVFEQENIIACQHAAWDAYRKDYSQACAICIPDGIFDKLCNEHIRRVNLHTQKYFNIPIHHDETIYNEMLIRDKFVPFEWFPIEKGIRWVGYVHTPNVCNALCFLRDKDFQEKSKHDF